MAYTMPKETRLNLRITDDFRHQIETLAEYHGLTLSGYAHSVLVRNVRREFQELEARGEAPVTKTAPVGARHETSEDPRDAIRKDFGIPYGGTIRLQDQEKEENRKKTG